MVVLKSVEVDGFCIWVRYHNAVKVENAAEFLRGVYQDVYGKEVVLSPPIRTDGAVSYGIRFYDQPTHVRISEISADMPRTRIYAIASNDALLKRKISEELSKYVQGPKLSI